MIGIDIFVGKGGHGGHRGGGHRGRGGARRAPTGAVSVYVDSVDAPYVCPQCGWEWTPYSKCACKPAVVGAGTCAPYDRLDASGRIIGAMPSFEQLQPYFLTVYPTTAAEMTLLYEQYLKSYDSFAGSIRSIWHPVSTAAVWSSLQAARSLITDTWKKGGQDSIVAVQMLAGIMGWFNANYVASDGSVKWDALNQPVNAGIIDGAKAAAQAAVDKARDAGQAVDDLAKKLADAARTAWWTMIGLAVAGVAVAGLLLWKLLGSDAGRAVAVRYLPGGRR